MQSISVQNYRCFHEEQTAILAPLTLLVGENSTGKSSLMAMMRGMWEATYGSQRIVDFNAEPFELGDFNSIVHSRGGRTKPPEQFHGKFTVALMDKSGLMESHISFSSFNSFPIVQTQRLVKNGYGISFGPQPDSAFLITPACEIPYDIPKRQQRLESGQLTLGIFPDFMGFPTGEEIDEYAEKLELGKLQILKQTISSMQIQSFLEFKNAHRPRATAPLRAVPKRTYDVGSSLRNAEGSNLANWLIGTFRNDHDQWKALKTEIESWGQALGLFSQFEVRVLNLRDGTSPFQIRVRGNPTKPKPVGPWRNWVDVGYGVGQVMPLLVELMDRSPALRLLQQPEIHLHPRAQAALGTILCQGVAEKRWPGVVVETHSDYLIDRIRMEVRDGKVAITPDDVSVVFFESRGLDVKIHNISFDQLGNVKAAPASYGTFFMDEVSRAIQ